jgi:hypothetical protein
MPCSEVEPMTGIEPAYSAWEVDSRRGRHRRELGSLQHSPYKSDKSTPVRGKTMTDLLELAIKAHGGMDRWNQLISGRRPIQHRG